MNPLPRAAAANGSAIADESPVLMTDPGPPDPVIGPAQAKDRLRAGVVIGSHGVVDFYAAIVTPLIPVLTGRLELTDGQVAAVIGLGSVCSGLIQPLAAWVSDRLETKALTWLGLAIAAIGIAVVPYAETFWQLMAIQAITTAGIGAFHPPAAAAAGRLAGRRRSLALTAFFVAGMVGGTIGLAASPFWVERFGLEGLVHFLLPGLAIAAILAWSVRGVGKAHAAHRRSIIALPAIDLRERWSAVLTMWVGNMIRFTVNMALVQLIIIWSEERALRLAGATAWTPELRLDASQTTGPAHAAMQVGMGLGGLVLGTRIRQGNERRWLVVIPILGAGAVAAFPVLTAVADESGVPRLGVAAAWAIAVGMGVGYAGLVPTTLNLAQRLLPHRTSLASGLMLGGAWFIAAIGPFLAQRLNASLGLTGAFGVVALALLASGVLGLRIRPALLERVAHH